MMIDSPTVSTTPPAGFSASRARSDREFSLPGIRIQLSIRPVMNLVLERCALPTVLSLRMRLEDPEGRGEAFSLVLQVPGFGGPLEMEVPSFRGETVLSGICPIFDAARLEAVEKATPASLEIQILRGGNPVGTCSSPLELLSPEEFPDTILPEALACHVVPFHPAVEKARDLARSLKSPENGGNGGNGLPPVSGRDRVRSIVASVFAALRERGVRVSRDSRACGASRKIKPHSWFTDDGGEPPGPLDLALIFSAVLEREGLFPLIFLEPDHAYCGCWNSGTMLKTPLLREVETVRGLVMADEILVLDPAEAFLEAVSSDFASALEMGRKRVMGDFPFTGLLDLKACRLARFMPFSPDAPAREEAPNALRGIPATSGMQDGTVPLNGKSGATSGAQSKILRIEGWKEKLLDLTTRNRLLNFRPSVARTVELAVEDLAAFEDQLAAGRVMTLHPIDLGRPDPRVREIMEKREVALLAKELREHLLKGRLVTFLTEKELARRMTNVARHARTELEESGSSSLFLGLGMLKWFESADSDVPRRAPILLYPIEVRRSDARSPYFIRVRQEEPRINETLLEKLRVEFSIDSSELRELPLDESGVDLKQIFSRIRSLVSPMPRFELLDEVFIDFFSFTKFLMWTDLAQHSDDLLKNDLVQHLAQGAGARAPGTRPGIPEGGGTGNTLESGFQDPALLDRSLPSEALPVVLDADSSQLVAVKAALDGKSFVLQGPPGTGKTQTIANIIACCLQAGKKVLFAAEKRVALEMVFRRLNGCGLGDFCLELHSSKADKSRIAQELARVLELPARCGDPCQTEMLRSLEEDRAALNSYVGRIHEILPLGISLFDAAGKLDGMKSVARLSIGIPGILDFPGDRFRACKEMLKTLGAAARELHLLKGNPFSFSRLAEWSPTVEKNIHEKIVLLRGADGNLQKSASEIRSIWPNLPTLKIGALSELAHLLELAGVDRGDRALELALRSDFDRICSEIRPIITTALEFQKGWSEFSRSFDLGILDEDLAGIRTAYRQNRDSFFLLRFFYLRHERGILQSHAVKPLPDIDGILALLDLGLRLVGLRTRLAEKSHFLASLAPGLEGQGVPEPDSLAIFLEQARSLCGSVLKLRGMGISLSGGKPALESPDFSRVGIGLRAAIAALQMELGRVAKAFEAEERELLPEGFGSVTPGQMTERSGVWLESIYHLRSWSGFIRAEAPLLKAGLGALTSALRAGTILPDDLEPVFETSFLEECLEKAFETFAELKGFSRAEQESRVERFRRMDRQFIASNPAVIGRTMSSQRPEVSGVVSPVSEVGILQREAKKKSGHMAIRRLFSHIPNLLSRLKPCLLMSPLSIAQYLPPSREPFDLVIFDEASQITTHDAVGAIARGKQVIVVGDSRQLPPTTFFQTGNDRDGSENGGHADENLVIDLESILDECTAANLPSIMLRWHYRSRDERLIAFSNRRYYDGKLSTFPAAGLLRRGGVFLNHMGGVFERGTTRINAAEAQAVVNWVVEALRDPERRKKSIGIVTFNLPQQIEIEDRLERERRKYPEIDPFFSDSVPEPVFVKNLENVQGDERDVILFSIGYGRDGSGTLTMNFGPLNRIGGERRLNVAVTRARERLEVFSSIEPEDIDLTRTGARGAADLREFLEFARQGAPAISGGSAGPDPKTISTVGDGVGRWLSAMGHRVEHGIGWSGCRIEIGIRDPDRPERFCLGIETDGPLYGDIPTARDRDRLRGEVLQGLGWRLHRVWLADWLHDREREGARIEEVLRDISSREPHPGFEGANSCVSIQVSEESEGVPKHSPAVAEGEGTGRKAGTHSSGAAKMLMETSQGTHAGASPTSEEPGPSPNFYREFPITRSGTAEEFFNSANSAKIRELIGKVLEAEAPVNREELFRRVAACFGFKRIGGRIQETLERGLGELVAAGEALVREGFVWRFGQDPASEAILRTPAPGGKARKPDLICPEEIAQAALKVMKASISLPRTDLVKAAAARFGFRRLPGTAVSSFERGIDLLVGTGQVTVAGDRLTLKE